MIKDVNGEPVIIKAKVCVVSRNVPLLIGKNTLKDWKAVQNYEEDKLIIKQKNHNEAD